jgi:hypothetical protein
LRAIVTNNIASGSFLVGSGNPAAAEIRDRLLTQVEVSTEHSTFFTENKVGGESREALIARSEAADARRS